MYLAIIRAGYISIYLFSRMVCIVVHPIPTCFDFVLFLENLSFSSCSRLLLYFSILCFFLKFHFNCVK